MDIQQIENEIISKVDRTTSDLKTPEEKLEFLKDLKTMIDDRVESAEQEVGETAEEDD